MVKTRNPMQLCRVIVFSLIFWHSCAFEFWLSSYSLVVYYYEVMLFSAETSKPRSPYVMCLGHEKSGNTPGSLKAGFTVSNLTRSWATFTAF